MADTLDIQTTVCRRCFSILDVTDNFCRVCGAATERGEDAAEVLTAQWIGDPATPDRIRAADSPLFVLAMLFFVLGPLGLPMVWRCRGLTRLWKVLLTALMLGLVVAMVGGAWYVFEHVLAPLRALGGPKRL